MISPLSHCRPEKTPRNVSKFRWILTVSVYCVYHEFSSNTSYVFILLLFLFFFSYTFLTTKIIHSGALVVSLGNSLRRILLLFDYRVVLVFVNV